jgi:hypothetical protein
MNNQKKECWNLCSIRPSFHVQRAIGCGWSDLPAVQDLRANLRAAGKMALLPFFVSIQEVRQGIFYFFTKLRAATGRIKINPEGWSISPKSPVHAWLPPTPHSLFSTCGQWLQLTIGVASDVREILRHFQEEGVCW